MSAPDRLCGLPKAAALTDLAKTIYYARAIVFSLDVPHWEAVAGQTRRDYVARAQELLETLRPFPVDERRSDVLFQSVVQSARSEAARVLARISEQAPYGEPFERDKP